LAEDGREIEFDTFDFEGHQIRAGESVYHPIERLTLHCDPQEVWRVVDCAGQVRTFSATPNRLHHAPIREIRSRCGFHAIHFYYDEAGRLSQVRDASGRTVELVHDARGRLVELYLPSLDGDGHTLHRRYGHDQQGDLVEVVDAHDHRWRFEYVGHLLARETDRSGLSFYFAYDGVGEDAWCIRTWGDGGIYDHVLSYDKIKKITFVTNSLGHTTRYEMNTVGLVTTIVDPLGGETHFEYDPGTLALIGHRATLCASTQLEYDERGNCTALRAGDVVLRADFHPSFNEPVRVCDAVGGEWHWEYDSLGRAIMERDPMGAVVQFRYEQGCLREIAASSGRRALLHRDRRFDIAAIDTDAGGRWLFERDRRGHVIAVRSPEGALQRRRHDLEDNLLEVTQPDGDVLRFEYDAEDNLVVVTDRWRRRELHHHGFHWLCAEVEGELATRLHHDSEGRVVAIENEHGERHELAYDPCGAIVRESCFDGRVHVLRRDRGGRLIDEVMPGGREVHYAYDERGHVAVIDHGGGDIQSFVRRADGELIVAESTCARVELRRDLLGRVLAERVTTPDGWSGSIESAYDGEGRRVAVMASTGDTARFEYHSSGRLAKVDVARASWSVAFVRDASGCELRRRYASGAEVRWTRDRVGRPRERTLVPLRGLNEQTRYVWEPGSRLPAISDDRLGEFHHRHDERGMLVGVQRSDGIERMRASLVRREGRGGQLDVDESASYEYDDEGRVVTIAAHSGERLHLTWSPAGLLDRVDRGDGRTICYDYDAFCRRIKKTVVAADGHIESIIRYIWAGQSPWVEQGESRRCLWVFGDDDFSPLAKIEHGDRSGYHAWSSAPDTVGSALDWFDDGGGIVCRGWLDPRGRLEVDIASTAVSPTRWPGQVEDPDSGLVYNRFRWYSPAQGRYISKDPAGLAGGFAAWNYVDDPLVASDPLGLVERFFRFVSEAEARQSASNLGGNGQLNPRPHGDSVGRGAKWITAEGAEPRLGKGTRPDWRIDIVAEDGTLAWLKRNGIDFDHVAGEAAAPKRVLLKGNEPGSFGVGVDLLDEFNRRVRGRITGSQTSKSGKKKKKCR
jgi:RHS repeat-associated protein